MKISPGGRGATFVDAGRPHLDRRRDAEKALSRATRWPSRSSRPSTWPRPVGGRSDPAWRWLRRPNFGEKISRAPGWPPSPTSLSVLSPARAPPRPGGCSPPTLTTNPATPRGAAGRLRTDRPGPAVVRAPRRHPRRVHRARHFALLPYFWHNGQYPDSAEYQALFAGNFADYRLRINSLVDNPVELDLVQLRALPHHE